MVVAVVCGGGGDKEIGGAVVIAYEILHVKMGYIRLAAVLPSVEDEEQGQIMKGGIGMCQKASHTILR